MTLTFLDAPAADGQKVVAWLDRIGLRYAALWDDDPSMARKLARWEQTSTIVSEEAVDEVLIAHMAHPSELPDDVWRTKPSKRDAVATAGVKPCPRCGVARPLSQWGRNKRRPDGLQSYCSPCRREMRSRNRESPNVCGARNLKRRREVVGRGGESGGKEPSRRGQQPNPGRCARRGRGGSR